VEVGVGSDTPPNEAYLSFKVNDQVVATSVISINVEKTPIAGFSRQGVDKYDQSGGPTQPVDMVITVKGSATSNLAADLTGPQSVVNIIMREYL
jgi:hypothetical protein